METGTIVAIGRWVLAGAGRPATGRQGRDLLHGVGRGMLQGYFFSRPLP